eukprot:gene18473-24965_t
MASEAGEEPGERKPVDVVRAERQADIGDEGLQEAVESTPVPGALEIDEHHEDLSPEVGPPATDTETKDAEAEDSGAKHSEAKDSELKDTEAKDSEAKDSESKVSEAQDSEAQDSEPKGTEAKDSEAKDSESKVSEAQDSEAQDSEPKDTEAKDAEAKDSESKVSEAQGSEAQNSRAKVSEAKDSEPKRGMAASLKNLAKKRWNKIKVAAAGVSRALAMAKMGGKIFQNNTKTALQAAVTGASGVQLNVENSTELRKIDYLHQGDATLYTDSNVEARHNIRKDVDFINSVRAWWR